MDEQSKNLLLATGLSFLVLLGWMLFFPPPPSVQPSPSEIADSKQSSEAKNTIASESLSEDLSSNDIINPNSSEPAKRVEIKTARLEGSLWLRGGRIDDLKLIDYRDSLDETSKNVSLMRPITDKSAYYAVHGWAAISGLDQDEVPNANTKWSLASGNTLTESSPIVLQWKNSKEVIFRKTIAIDENYMFSIKQTVLNRSNRPLKLYPYGILARHGQPKTIGFYILHEGVVAVRDGELIENNYDDMTELPFSRPENGNAEVQSVSSNGWIGFTDKYWMSTLIPKAGQRFEMAQKFNQNTNIYQVDVRLPSILIEPGNQIEVETNLFTGAKEVNTIKQYEADLNIENFVDSVDWGWFFFLTKPIFSLLDWFDRYTNNMGWSIIVLTLFIKTLLFPLAYKSYVSMSRMKKLQPEMEKLKEVAGDDKTKLQQGMMALYKKEKVNPAAGCLPILLQIPIFFSLYKVLFVTIEMRHAPFIGWIHDLSAPDPTSFMNLFGLLPYSPPDPNSLIGILSIGVFPILMGVTMWLQQKLNPSPTDKTQAMIFAWMPWVFMFMLGQFSSGLVIYWVANNTITFIQQYLIMTTQGVKPDIFGNILKSFKKSK